MTHPSLTQRVMREGAERAPTQFSLCPCGSVPRFETDAIGRTVEYCDCGYRGPQRATTTLQPRSGYGPTHNLKRVRVVPDTKYCRGCHETKPIEDFYEHDQMRDGHATKCKQCVNKAHAKRKKAEARRRARRGALPIQVLSSEAKP